METETTSMLIGGGTADWLTTASPPNPTKWIRNFGLYVHFCAVGVIIPVGLVCNAFSIGIFLTATKFRRTSTGQLLIALSAVDWLVLIGDALKWLNRIDQDQVSITGLSFYETSDFACKFVNLWRYSTKLLSVWLTVVITMERLIAVAMPLKVGRLSTPFRMRCVVAVLAVVCFALNLFPLWTLTCSGPDGIYCQYALGRRDEYLTWLLAVRRVGALALPITLLIICSSLIIFFLARAHHTRPQSTRGGGHAVTLRQQSSKDKSKSTQRQLTIMLVSVCIAAICLQLPYMILYEIRDRRRDWWPDEPAERYAWIYAGTEIAEAMSIANHAINFFLFCVSGSSFRQQVRKALPCVRSLRRSSLDGTPTAMTRTSASRYATSPTIRFQVRQQNDHTDDEVIRLAD